MIKPPSYFSFKDCFPSDLVAFIFSCIYNSLIDYPITIKKNLEPLHKPAHADCGRVVDGEDPMHPGWVTHTKSASLVILSYLWNNLSSPCDYIGTSSISKTNYLWNSKIIQNWNKIQTKILEILKNYCFNWLLQWFSWKGPSFSEKQNRLEGLRRLALDLV